MRAGDLVVKAGVGRCSQHLEGPQKGESETPPWARWELAIKAGIFAWGAKTRTCSWILLSYNV